MPLCPTCIRQHTQYHQDIKTKPAYFSIYEIISEVKQLAYAAINNLEQDNLKRVLYFAFRLKSFRGYRTGMLLQLRPLPRLKKWSWAGFSRSLYKSKKISLNISMKNKKSSVPFQKTRLKNGKMKFQKQRLSSMIYLIV